MIFRDLKTLIKCAEEDTEVFWYRINRDGEEESSINFHIPKYILNKDIVRYGFPTWDPIWWCTEEEETNIIRLMLKFE